MTNQTIPVADLRAVLDGEGSAADMIEVIREMLPTPPRPTLENLTPEERAECKWMQADVPEVSPDQTCIITRISPGGATVLDRDGVAYRWFALDSVTPRPDLPRLEWPGGQKPAPAPALPDGWRLADHQKHGRVIVTNPTPDPRGHVYFVLPSDTVYMGYYWFFCDPSELTYLDTEPEADQ